MGQHRLKTGIDKNSAKINCPWKTMTLIIALQVYYLRSSGVSKKKAMTTLLEQAGTDYLLQPGIDGLHAEATNWVSELEFCKAELQFLNKLLDKYFLRVKGEQKLLTLEAMEKKVRSFRSKILSLALKKVLAHKESLATLSEQVFHQDEQRIREEHQTRKLDVQELLGNEKKIKQEIFAFVERELKEATKTKPGK